jgi:hypothetical protein
LLCLDVFCLTRSLKPQQTLSIEGRVETFYLI